MKASRHAKRLPFRKPAPSIETPPECLTEGAAADSMSEFDAMHRACARLMRGQARTMLLSSGSIRITQAVIKGKGGKPRIIYIARHARTGAAITSEPRKFLPSQIRKRILRAASQAQIEALLAR